MEFQNNILNRSIFSFIAIGLRSAFTLTIGIILARTLGPNEYGTFIFLVTSLTVLSSLIDFGSTSAFFTFISKKERGQYFIFIFFCWKIFQFFLSSLVIFYLLPDKWVNVIWNGENRILVLLAFASIFSQFHVWKTIEKIGESRRLTFRVQSVSTSFTFIQLITIIALVFLNILSIQMIFALIVIEWFIASIIGSILINPKNTKSIEKNTFLNILLEYKNYCLPLIPYILLSILSDFGDTWFLQNFGGSVEQAYYQVAAQISAISLLATTSILQIFWKEIASANEKGDIKTLKNLYDTSSKTLFLIAALISCFFIPWASEIINVLLGNDYLDGKNAFLIMLVYPIYQCLGQVNNIMFYSLEHTRKFAQISSIWFIVSFVSAYLLIAPNGLFIPGLDLGSEGLAIKMVLLQFIFVFYTTYWISKKYNWKLDYYYQIITVSIFLLISISLKFIIFNTFIDFFGLILTFFITGVSYLLIIMLLLINSFNLFKINNKNIETGVNYINNKLKSVVK